MIFPATLLPALVKAHGRSEVLLRVTHCPGGVDLSKGMRLMIEAKCKNGVCVCVLNANETVNA